MSSRATGIVLAVLIVVSSAFFVSYELNVPKLNTFSFSPVPANATQFVDVTLYAEQPGWDYNLGPSLANPTLVFQVGTVVNFTVIEEDTLIHNLAINPGSSEASNASILLNIGPPQLSVQKAQVYFSDTGIYTYWCTVHPTTMVGRIYVNKTVSNTYSLPPLPAGYPVNYSYSFTMDSGYIANSTGSHNPNLFYPTGSAVNFTIIQGVTSNSSFNIAFGSAESSYNETAVNASALGNTPGNHKSFFAYFKTPGEYTYWNAYSPNSTEGHVFIADNNQTAVLNVTNTGIMYGGSSNFTIAVANSTNVRFVLNDSGSFSYSFSISGNPADEINMSGSTGSVFYLSFQQAGQDILNASLPSASTNSIDVYLKEVNLTVDSTLTGFVINGVNNPNLNFTQYTIVRFTLNNSDNLNNSLVINAGGSANLSNHTIIALTPAGTPASTGYYLFINAGTYTLWNTYHPSSDILEIDVTSLNLSAGGSSSTPAINNLLNNDNPIAQVVTACDSRTY